MKYLFIENKNKFFISLFWSLKLQRRISYPISSLIALKKRSIVSDLSKRKWVVGVGEGVGVVMVLVVLDVVVVVRLLEVVRSGPEAVWFVVGTVEQAKTYENNAN